MSKVENDLVCNVKCRNTFIIRISLGFIVSLIVLLLLNCPSFISEPLTIYSIEYEHALGDYAKLSYSFSLLNFFMIIFGVLCVPSCVVGRRLLYILSLVFIKDAILFLAGYNSPFLYNSWEMYLSVGLAIAAWAIVSRYNKKLIELYFFSDGLIVFNFIYQLLFLLTGRAESSGRVGVMNQDTGSVGFMCALQIMYMLLIRKDEKNKVILITISAISLLLSGSRFSFLILILGVICFCRTILGSLTLKRKVVTLLSLVICAIILVFMLNSSVIRTNSLVLDRVFSLLDGGVIQNIGKDESFVQRVESIGAGMEILKERPLGLSNSYIDLQGETIKQGFFSFPHSFILTYYLMWGPVMLVIAIWMFWLAKRAKALGEYGVCKYIIYLLICFTVYGGIITSTKVYVYLIGVFILMNKYLADKSVLKGK